MILSKKIEINNIVIILKNRVLTIQEFTSADDSRYVNLDDEEIEVLFKFLKLKKELE